MKTATLAMLALAGCTADAPVAADTRTELTSLGRVALDADTLDPSTRRVTRAGGEPAMLVADLEGTVSLHFFDGTVVDGPTTQEAFSVLGGDDQPTVVMGSGVGGMEAWTASRAGFEPLEGWAHDWAGREGVVADGVLWGDLGDGPLRYTLGSGAVDAYPGDVPDDLYVVAPSLRAGRYAQADRGRVVWLDLATETWRSVDLPPGLEAYTGVLDPDGHYVLKVFEPDARDVLWLARLDLTTGRLVVDRTQEVPRSFLVATPDGVALMVWLDDDPEHVFGGELFEVRFER